MLKDVEAQLQEWEVEMKEKEAKERKKIKYCSDCRRFRRNNDMCGLVSVLCVNSDTKPYFVAKKDANTN